MDVVLELFDTFLFDRLYATFLPAFPQQQRLTKSQRYYGDSFNSPNSTLSSVPQTYTGYFYEPASQLFSVEPTDFAYMSRLPRDNMIRQSITLFLVTWLFGVVIYFGGASLSYFFIFDKENFKHPKYVRNQIVLEMQQAVRTMPIVAFLTTPFFLAEVQGFSKMYDTSADGPGLWYDIAQFPLFICFTDFFIYWIHRGLHHPRVYKYIHKSHHRWIVPTPYASLAFHPLDGMAQSLPYHCYPFLFPLQKFAYIALFIYINIWSIMIHDGEYAMNSPFINGAACHTMHHLYFNYNYGQFTTFWDRVGGSYRKPNQELFRREEKLSQKEFEKQAKRSEEISKEIEGKDERQDESHEKKAIVT